MEDLEASKPPNEADIALLGQSIAAGLSLADAAGLDRRLRRAMVWHATITALLEFASPDLAMAYLEDRAATIKGYGVNGDSPVQTLSPEDRAIRAQSIPIGAEIVYDQVAGAIDAVDDQDRDGIAAFVQAALLMLKEWWGPIHLRRIVLTQVKALRAGQYAPIMPLEPLLLNKPKSPGDAPPRRTNGPRHATIVLMTGSKTPRWGLTAEISEVGGEQKEQRSFSGLAAGQEQVLDNLARTLLIVLQSFDGVHPEDKIKVVTDLPRDPLLGAQSSGTMDRLSTLLVDHKVEWSSGEESRRLIERTRKALDEKA